VLDPASYAIFVNRLRLTRTWVVSFSILSQFIRVGAVVAARRRERVVAAMAS
jgi:hypothetical protein